MKTLILLFLSGCAVPAFGGLPEFGAKEACQEGLVAMKHHWSVCNADLPDNYDQLWNDCDRAVSASFQPITSSQMTECLGAIDMVSCDDLEQSNPPQCTKLFFHP